MVNAVSLIREAEPWSFATVGGAILLIVVVTATVIVARRYR